MNRNNINPAYLNGYKGGAYNIAITAFEIDGGAVGLFQYAKEQEWQEVFNKEKEGNPAKKFPTTRPFAIEQDFPNNSIPHDSDGVNKYSDRDSTGPRFDSNVQDDAAKEQRSAQEQPTVHSLLMETDASKVKNATERKYLKEYRQTANLQLAEQQKLDKLQAELDALPKEKRQTSRARFLRDALIKTKNRLQICQSIQTRLETNSPLTYLIHREIKPRVVEKQRTSISQMQAKTETLPSEHNSEGDVETAQDKQTAIPQIDLERQHKQERPLSIGVAKVETHSIINSNTSYQKPEKTLPHFSLEPSLEKKDNKSVREWYVEQVLKNPDFVDRTLPIEEQAKQAFEARSKIRTEARKMMADEETRKNLDEKHPNKTFEELVESKMKRKGMTREEAILDILKTATKTNHDVNKELGVGGRIKCFRILQIILLMKKHLKRRAVLLKCC